MRWSKLGLLIPALTLGWLATASVRADEVAPAAGVGPDAAVPAEMPAGNPAEAPGPDVQVPADTAPSQAEAEPAVEESLNPDAAALEDPGTEPASVAQDDAASAAEALAVDEAGGGEIDASAASEDPSAEAADASVPALGAVGYDSQGRAGRVHIVRRGDTLWDISDAYLGTPWVWPSIWHDNDQVENPHRIYPGDHIWITPNEMRKITAEEAAILLSNLPPGSEVEPAAAEEVFPTEVAPSEPQLVSTPVERGSLRVAERESIGLITAEQFEAAASIVGRVPERVLLSQQDQVYIGAGEGAVQVGDELTIFRTNEKVFDPDTGRLLGYHVDFLGYVEVTETYPDSSLAKIRMSTGEIQQGDRLTPREMMPKEIAIQPSPAEVEGKISFFPRQRVVIGWNDFVYLNRGSVDGLEVGSPLEVFRRGYATDEPARDETVHVPDRVVAKLVVVRTADESSVALITKSETELRLGDLFRGTPE